VAAACGSGPGPLCSAVETASGCAVRTELYFGLSRPDGGTVSEAEWQGFLADAVTPLFPAGFTVIAAEGQWQEAGPPATIVREPTRLLVIVHGDPADDGRIDALIDNYKRRFAQQSVLRLDSKTLARF
jgi:hypothetical protein